MNMESKIKPEKPRAENWDPNETSHLVGLLQVHIQVVDNKRNDIKSITAKKEAWASILAQFELKYGNRRNLLELKEKWKRIKLAAKKEVTEHNRSSRATGGGEAPPPLSALTVAVEELCPRDFVQIANPFDDDAAATTSASAVDMGVLSAEQYLQGQGQGSGSQGFDILDNPGRNLQLPVGLGVPLLEKASNLQLKYDDQLQSTTENTEMIVIEATAVIGSSEQPKPSISNSSATPTKRVMIKEQSGSRSPSPSPSPSKKPNKKNKMIWKSASVRSTG
ncbi:uncharacterized protein [Amphiura filiformis]|uniref:uncharacterized protein n=1 Tax=Amphiura filiformis TaxID=82378 RepID=UPI003B220513